MPLVTALAAVITAILLGGLTAAAAARPTAAPIPVRVRR